MAKRNSYYWLCQVGGWGLVGLSMLFYGITFKDEISTIYLYRILIYVLTGILSTHILREFLKRTNWLLLPIEKMVTRLGAAVVLTSILYGLLVLGAYELFHFENKGNYDFTTRLFANVLNIGIFMIPWILLYYLYHYVENSRRQQVDTLKLESLVKELELKTIKSHINPHFIFNALNSIRALIDENPSRARNAITELSNILRSSMQTEKQETVPFEKELNIVKDYLALEYIRFEDRLKIEYQIDEDTLDQPVPPMMLQTLVENAIKHGIGKQISGGVVRVISDFKNDFHEMVVLNSGSLNGHANGDGFGLSSTRNRLQLLFGERANFEIKQVDAGLVEARILIPVELK